MKGLKSDGVMEKDGKFNGSARAGVTVTSDSVEKSLKYLRQSYVK